MLLAEYLDTTIILNAADSTFAGTLGLNEATSSGLKTTDNKVYTVSSIKIQSHTYNLWLWLFVQFEHFCNNYHLNILVFYYRNVYVDNYGSVMSIDSALLQKKGWCIEEASDGHAFLGYVDLVLNNGT